MNLKKATSVKKTVWETVFSEVGAKPGTEAIGLGRQAAKLCIAQLCPVTSTKKESSTKWVALFSYTGLERDLYHIGFTAFVSKSYKNSLFLFFISLITGFS